MAKLSDIEGIGPKFEAKLKDIGIGSLEKRGFNTCKRD